MLRFHFSFFLLPVYLFALSQVPAISWGRAALVFVILHLLVYPSSNGYNSYMDRDEESIGGVKNPLPPTRELFYASIVMDSAAILLGLLVSAWFTIALIAYILASRAYSYRGIRLKKYPITGYLTVIIFQGAVTFFMVYHGCSANKTLYAPPLAMIAASLLIGGFYPLTQIYQHEADRKDGVVTLSAALGRRGTFVFTAIVYSMAMVMLAWYFVSIDEKKKFFGIATSMLPVIVYFLWWAVKAWNNEKAADFSHAMRMNGIAAIFTNLAFMLLLTGRFF